MNASLNEKLRTVKWGEFKINQLFKPMTIKRKIKGEDVSEKGIYPAYSSDSDNNGIVGYYEIPEFICDSNNPIYVIFGDHTRTMSIAYNSFSVLDNVKVLRPYIINKKALLFIFSVWKKEIPNLGYKRHWSIAKKCILRLPITSDGSIDFDFMESFVAELEAERVAELEAERVAELTAYLKVSGLDNYELSSEEKQAIEDYKSCYDKQWGTYKVGSLFARVSTKKLPYKANDLPKQPVNDYVLPCLTSSFQNQGLNYYVPKKGATILSNVISIPSNSDVYRAYYQSREFTVLSDAYAIKWTGKTEQLSAKQYLFFVMCINKRTNLSIYSYKNKLGGWNVVKNIDISLPEKDGKPDYEYMDLLISAIQKLVIKDVVLYTQSKVDKTKEVINQNL